jgi:hypothetical protein
MKVKISNYPTTRLICRIHDRYMNKKYGHVWPHPSIPTKIERFLELLESIIQSFYDVTINPLIKNREQKINVRIDDWDTWSADVTLSHIIYPLLLKIKEDKFGTPYTDREDAPDDVIYDDNIEDNDWDRPFNAMRWHYILNEMIFAFDKIRDDEWDLEIYERHQGWSEEATSERDDVQKRINNGLRLFAKYYQSLWT